MARKEETGEFRLDVPLDASGIEDFKPEQPVKVVARDGDGKLQSQTVQLNAKGQGSASFKFAGDLGAVQVFVGPHDATDEEIQVLQTITFSVSRRNWLDKLELRLQPVRISPYYWYWWLRWCRTFVIRGRVLCPDGSPVVGANVCAFDVDWWWWWLTNQQVGCDTTDATGSFEIKFRWCCGWWPWWWLKLRRWQFEPALADRILPVLQVDPTLPRLAKPAPQPSLQLFDTLLGDRGSRIRNPGPAIDPAVLPSLRDKLLQRLPRAPELERLRVWPWWPWQPWWDCTPDIIFRVTQNCGGNNVVIVNEGFFDARWNIPTSLDVTLTALDPACCTRRDPDPVGNCLDIVDICGIDPVNVGGNLSAPATPAGYANPNLIAAYGDRPFAGGVTIHGRFGTLATADYYELEYFNEDPAVNDWEPAPPNTVAGFTRSFYGPALPAGAIDTHYVPFPVTLINGHYVIESRQHFEANNGAGTWEIVALGSRWWHAERDTLLTILTENTIFSEGTFKFRIRSWQRVGNNLVVPQILPHCGTNPAQDNHIVLRTDNRYVGGGPVDTHGKPCGAVHFCTTEPDTNIIDVKIVHADTTETAVASCGTVQINDTDKLRIDFLAQDTDGHLADYTLRLTYGENEYVDLVWTGSPGELLATEPSASLVALAAAQIGPEYGNADPTRSARNQGATSPTWAGGSYRFEVLAKKAFPKTCCYQLDLTANKRNIVSCSTYFWNQSQLSFLVNV